MILHSHSFAGLRKVTQNLGMAQGSSFPTNVSGQGAVGDLSPRAHSAITSTSNVHCVSLNRIKWALIRHKVYINVINVRCGSQVRYRRHIVVTVVDWIG